MGSPVSGTKKISSTSNIMTPAPCWLNVSILCFLLRHALCGWMPRTFPCDVTVKNSSIIFDCDSRGLTEIPDGITRNATAIYLSENKIENISVKAFNGLQELTHIDLSWANSNLAVHISNGTFSNLTNLRELKLSGNVLQEVPKNLPPGLSVLALDNNKITNLSHRSFSNIKNVTEINLSKNCYYWNPCGKKYDAGNRSFSALTNLRILILGHSNLTCVPKGLPNSLEILMLNSNQIQQFTDEDFRGLTNLRQLRIEGNCPRCQNAPYPCVPCPNRSLQIHPSAFTNLAKLETLDLSGNSLNNMSSSWFESLGNLKILFLSYNFLHNDIAEGGFLNNLLLLEKMDLSYNFDFQSYPLTLNLSSNFSKLRFLKTLHIEGYVFREICNDTLSPLVGLKNLTVLNLSTNFIVHSNFAVFHKLSNLKLIFLSENRLYPVTTTSYSDQCRNPSLANGMGDSFHQHLNMCILTDGAGGKEHLHEQHRVKPECLLAGRVLDLSSNNLFFISSAQFEGFGNISCLNLSNNGFAAALNGTEFKALSELTYLDLSFNRIDLAYDRAFSELKKLQVLDLSNNPHYFNVPGVTHNLNFLEHLPSLRVLNMSNNNIFTLTSKTMKSKSLSELQFHNNRLGTLWKEKDRSYIQLFKHLVNLTLLDISYNEIEKIPSDIYDNLPQNLTKLYLGHNKIKDFEWKKLKLFQHLQFLDLSHNSISMVSKNLSVFTKSLEHLDLKNNKIMQLFDKFLQGAKSIHVLDLRHNWLTIINQSTFGKVGSDNYLQTLYLSGNPFHCTCENLDFIVWIEKNDVRIPHLATRVTCGMPAQRQHDSVIKVDIKECIDNEITFLLHFLSALFIVITMISATAMHLFYWDASYILHYWRAKLKGYHRLESTDNVYDAFITYDTKDQLVSDWVMNHLRVEVEEGGDKLSAICLEERDWIPGVPVIENLSQSIRQSRKTVFVLTEAYVRSGTFKMAVYLAHQRLLEDNDDVIVLLLLEPVLCNSHFLRLRRRLCDQSVLEWPQNPSAEQWFWQCLRNSIRMDNHAFYSKQYSRYFTSKENQSNQYSSHFSSS